MINLTIWGHEQNFPKIESAEMTIFKTLTHAFPHERGDKWWLSWTTCKIEYDRIQEEEVKKIGRRLLMKTLEEFDVYSVADDEEYKEHGEE